MDENSMCTIMGKALDLEEEGMKFYTKCKETTKDENGKEMFSYLAKEEIIHYNKVAEIFKTYLNKGYCDYIAARQDKPESGVFEKNFPGGGLNDKTDILAALNIGINAEENSIKLYKQLAEDSENDEAKMAFQKLATEEQKHKSILENEIEFVTGTGEFHDFKQVTS
ncbi:MAG: ferritin family protein [Candidatus Altiarchaeota archaeon]|nr:ferritin family protein [Candidatus Altiarchaeota archaeon]